MHLISHHVDLLLEANAVQLLEEAADETGVLDDIVSALDEAIIQTPSGRAFRYEADLIISATGMDVLESYASGGEGELSKVCESLVGVAEPTESGSLVGEASPTGDSRQVHAFEREFDPMEETDVVGDMGGDVPDLTGFVEGLTE